MKPFVIATAGAVVAIIGFFLLWDWVFPSDALRCRLTIDVEADGRIHTGSGVIEVSFARQGTMAMKPSIKGEAIAVDLGARGLFFVLLVASSRGSAVPDVPAMVVKEFKLAPSVGSLKVEDLRRLAKTSTRVELPLASLPMLVRFRSRDDPTSVEQVDPSNLEKHFGPGVRLVRARIETTRDPITTGIEKRLTWLPNIERRSGALDGTRFPGTNDLRSNLGSLAFRRWGV
jgi:hypothetical protein